MAPVIHDGSIIESHAAAVGEVWRAFGALFSITLEEHREFVPFFKKSKNTIPY